MIQIETDQVESKEASYEVENRFKERNTKTIDHCEAAERIHLKNYIRRTDNKNSNLRTEVENSRSVEPLLQIMALV